MLHRLLLAPAGDVAFAGVALVADPLPTCLHRTGFYIGGSAANWTSCP